MKLTGKKAHAATSVVSLARIRGHTRFRVVSRAGWG
jgi:hypothetical protein